ncbi:MAG: B12-binding domain-containing radical SAM protein [Anaerolineae bacterium]
MSRGLVVLVDPPVPPGTTANRDGAGGLGAFLPGEGGFRYPSLALAVAAGALRSAGWPVRVVDAPGEALALSQALDRLPQEAKAAVVLASWATAEADAAFLRALREARPGLKVLVLMAVPDLWASEAVTRLADAWTVGDGDLYAPWAVEALLDGARGALLPRALGLAGFSEEGRREALEGLPVPAWDLLPWQRYPFLTALTSRGCPDGCAYCPYAVGQGRTFRARPPEEVVEELVHVARAFRPPRVILRDPVFARDGARATAIAEGLARARVRLLWECESRPEHFVEARLLRILRRGGCGSIKVGVESADPRLLSALGRVQEGMAAAYLEAVRRAREASRAADLPFRPFVMVGLPGQTTEDVRRTAEFLEDLGASYLHVKRFVCYPGTRLWQEGVPLPDEAAVREWEAILRGVSLAPAPGRPWWWGALARLRRVLR